MNRISLTEQLSQIQNCYGLKRSLLKSYFETIFDQISISLENDKKENFCNLSILSLYLNLPLILSKRFFYMCNEPIKEILTKSKFVDIIFKFYFGTLDEMIEIFFNTFNMDDNKKLNLKNFLLAINFLTNDENTRRKFEQAVKVFNKKTNFKSNFQIFQNYILSEDTFLFINFFKLIYERQPFTFNVIKHFELMTPQIPEEEESINDQESDEYMSKHSQEKSKIFSLSLSLSYKHIYIRQKYVEKNQSKSY